ncbi:STAS domain-containing protein [Peribacillus sp. B-H-3]|uniref:STAS domain-containing protein n=1 Tax=Peribacillus sp. B-H-3 TaxID=3400420 RepID=UPI003B012651
MESELKYIGKKIVENQLKLAKNLGSLQGSEYSERLKYSDASKEQLIEWRSMLISYLGASLYGNKQEIEKKVKDWARMIGEYSIRNHVPLVDTLRALTYYRSVIWDAFTEELEKRQFAAITMLDVSKKIDPLLDSITEIFGDGFEKHNKNLMNIAYSALEELSVPIVPVYDNTAIVPVIGEIDPDRAKLIMDITLRESTKLNLKVLIIDLSGVPMIDETATHKIAEIINALKLTGVEAILTGIRPRIAQTIIRLGLDFQSFNIRGSLRQILNELQAR